MAFVRDHGAACLCVPLKLAVGLICMYIFGLGCFSLVGFLKSTANPSTTQSMTVNMQQGGYNPWTFKLQTFVGVIGIFTGFFGLLGVYDDKPGWIRTLYHYLQVRLLCNVIVFVFDIFTLRDCKNFVELAAKKDIYNPAIEQLSRQDMCWWGRWAYVIGYVLITLVDLYMLYYVWVYTRQIELNPPYPIDFGYEQYDASSRWAFYKATPPEELPLFKAEKTTKEDKSDNRVTGKYAADGSKAANTYAPDGMRGPAYIRAFR